MPGGDLRVATDVEEYYGVIRALMADPPPVRSSSPSPSPRRPSTSSIT